MREALGAGPAPGPRRRGAGRRGGADARRRQRGRARRAGRGAARGHRGAAGGPAPRVGAARRRGVIVRRDRRDSRHRPGHGALATASRAPAIEGETGAVRMTCTETRDLFSALADDALTPAERAALDAHLAGCAECRRELAAFGRTVALVRAIDPAHAPAGFVDRVLAAARPEPWPRWLARRLSTPWPTLPLGAVAESKDRVEQAAPATRSAETNAEPTAPARDAPPALEKRRANVDSITTDPAKAGRSRQDAAPLSRTGPMTGILAAPPDVTAQ